MKIVHKDQENHVPIHKMKNGDIAEVIKWDGNTNHSIVGLLIQRYGNVIVLLGKPSGQSYPSLLDCGAYLDDYIVRILERGTVVNIEV